MKKRKSIKNWASDDRPREKLIENGPKSLSSTELLGILINSGSKQKSAVDIAREILDDCDNKIEVLCNNSFSDFLKYEGIGPAKAVTIAAAMELISRRENSEVVHIKNSTDILNAVSSKIIGLTFEVSYVIYLNAGNRIIKIENLSKGGLDQTVIDNRLILSEALKLNASAIILIHNHPSGNIKPSANDDFLTKNLKDACNIIGIKLLDHIIIGKNGKDFFSYNDDGKL